MLSYTLMVLTLNFGLIEKGRRNYLGLISRNSQNLFLLPNQRWSIQILHIQNYQACFKEQTTKYFYRCSQYSFWFLCFYGRYQAQIRTCEIAGSQSFISNEKKTDVNIATEMMVEPFRIRWFCYTRIRRCWPHSSLKAIRKLFLIKRSLLLFPQRETRMIYDQLPLHTISLENTTFKEIFYQTL